MEPEALTADGKPRCIGRVCGPAIKALYPGAKDRFPEDQCKRVCKKDATQCETCLANEALYMAGTNTKKRYHGVIGGPITPYSHIIGSEWNLTTREKNAAKAAKAAAADEKKATTMAVKIFAEAESAAAAVAKAATKERKEAEAAAKAAATEAKREAAELKKREAEERRATAVAARTEKAAAAAAAAAKETERRMGAFGEQLSGRLGWAQIGHRPFLPTALLPYSSSNGTKGYQARPGSARRTSSARRSSARRSNAAKAIQRAFRTRKAGRNARGRFTSSTRRASTARRSSSASLQTLPELLVPWHEVHAKRAGNAASKIQRAFRTRKATAPSMPIIAAAPKSSSSSAASNLGGNMFGLENMNANGNGALPELD